MNTQNYAFSNIRSRSVAGNIVRVALSTALIMVSTMVSLPIMMGGYVHLGDALIFLSVIFLSWWAIPAAAIGSALADMTLGYAFWAPATFAIKGIMALIARLILGRCTSKNQPSIVRMLVAFIVASMFMQFAYLGYQYLMAFAGFDVELLEVAFYLIVVNFLLGLSQSAVAVPLSVALGRRLGSNNALYI